MSATGRYAFAVARGLPADSLTGASGFHGAPLRVVEHAGLSAVVCDVDLDEFGEQALADNLEDLAWVEWAARTHNDVVWLVAGSATCAPLRLVTVCLDDDSVRAKVDALRDDLEQVLDRVEGRQEWSLKVLVPHRTAVEVPAGPAPSSGADYLRRKREAAEQRRGHTEDAAHAAHRIDEVARNHAVATRHLPPQDPRLTGRSDAMILNAAYLVEAAAQDTFRTAVRATADQHEHVSVELDGPWPPYSFAVLG